MGKRKKVAIVSILLVTLITTIAVATIMSMNVKKVDKDIIEEKSALEYTSAEVFIDNDELIAYDYGDHGHRFYYYDNALFEFLSDDVIIYGIPKSWRERWSQNGEDYYKAKIPNKIKIINNAYNNIEDFREFNVVCVNIVDEDISYKLELLQSLAGFWHNQYFDCKIMTEQIIHNIHSCELIYVPDSLEFIAENVSTIEYHYDSYADEIIIRSASLVRKEGGSSVVIIENEIFGHSVTRIEEESFSGAMVVIVLPESITDIGSGAFKHCEFEDLIINSNKYIRLGEYAFASVNPIRVDSFISIPNRPYIDELGKGAFSGVTIEGYNTLWLNINAEVIHPYAFLDSRIDCRNKIIRFC